MGKRKKRKKKSKKQPKAKNKGEAPPDVWRQIAHGTMHRLSASGWVANFFIGVALLLIGPLIGLMVRNARVAIVCGALGLTALVWIVAIIAIQQVSGGRIEETAVQGLLVPANKPSPPVPPSCPTTPNAMRVYLGDSLGLFTAPQVTIIEVAGERLLSVEKKAEGISINAKIFSGDGRIVAEVKDNEFFINPNNYFRRERPDKSTLIVYDQQSKEVLNIEYLNPLEIAVAGRFIYPKRKPVIVDAHLHIGGNTFTRACLGNATDSVISID